MSQRRLLRARDLDDARVICNGVGLLGIRANRSGLDVFVGTAEIRNRRSGRGAIDHAPLLARSLKLLHVADA